MLAAGVPLTLLCDLLEPAGPHSSDILEHERDEDALAWIPATVAATPEMS